MIIDASGSDRAAHYQGKTTLSVVLIAIVAASGEGCERGCAKHDPDPSPDPCPDH